MLTGQNYSEGATPATSFDESTELTPNQQEQAVKASKVEKWTKLLKETQKSQNSALFDLHETVDSHLSDFPVSRTIELLNAIILHHIYGTAGPLFTDVDSTDKLHTLLGLTTFLARIKEEIYEVDYFDGMCAKYEEELERISAE